MADKSMWLYAITQAARAFNGTAPARSPRYEGPWDHPLGPDQFIKSVEPVMMGKHDYKEVQTNELTSILNAWKVSLGLPSTAADAMHMLLSGESEAFHSFNFSVDLGGIEKLTLVAGGGRNWGGIVSIAFAMSDAEGGVVLWNDDVQCGNDGPGSACPCYNCGCSCEVNGKGCNWNNRYYSCGPPDNGVEATRPVRTNEIPWVRQAMMAHAFDRLQAEQELLRADLIGFSSLNAPSMVAYV